MCVLIFSSILAWRSNSALTFTVTLILFWEDIKQALPPCLPSLKHSLPSTIMGLSPTFYDVILMFNLYTHFSATALFILTYFKIHICWCSIVRNLWHFHTSKITLKPFSTERYRDKLAYLLQFFRTDLQLMTTASYTAETAAFYCLGSYRCVATGGIPIQFWAFSGQSAIHQMKWLPAVQTPPPPTKASSKFTSRFSSCDLGYLSPNRNSLFCCLCC